MPSTKGGVTSCVQDDNLFAYILTGHDQVAFIDQGHNNAPIIYSGGALHNLGQISASIIVDNGQEKILVVAGKNGCALLVDGDGHGLPTNMTYQDFLQNKELFSFKKVLDCKDVKKLVTNNNKLFVLCKNSLTRVDIAHWQAEVIASPATFNNNYILFNDCFMSGKLCLLGTSQGLFRNNNYTNISTLDQHASNWSAIPLTENVGPVTQLLVISPTHKEEECATHSAGGNLYVLNAHRGKDQARVYRFTLNPTGEITDQTIQQLPDCFVKNKPSFFINIGSYRTGIYTNGGSFFLYNNAYVADKKEPNPFCELLFPGWASGKSFLTQSALKTLNFPKAHRIGNIVRNASTGHTIIYGDFGLCIYE